MRSKLKRVPFPYFSLTMHLSGVGKNPRVSVSSLESLGSPALAVPEKIWALCFSWVRPGTHRVLQELSKVSGFWDLKYSSPAAKEGKKTAL